MRGVAALSVAIEDESGGAFVELLWPKDASAAVAG
jgi:hypothetical protein